MCITMLRSNGKSQGKRRKGEGTNYKERVHNQTMRKKPTTIQICQGIIFVAGAYFAQDALKTTTNYLRAV